MLLTDGYGAYAQYAARLGLVHAQCWTHTRRTFERAKDIEPAAGASALERIGALYRIEAEIRAQGLTGAAKRAYRLTHAKPVVNAFFVWAERQVERAALLPSNPLTKRAALRPGTARGIERLPRRPRGPHRHQPPGARPAPHPDGSQAWLFCWSEVGAEAVAILQSLVVTGRLHDIDPYEYLVDVLQRIDRHPAREVHLLTPRLWKQHFAANPLRSDLQRLPG